MIIYKITCLVTNKVYIGLTIQTLKKRWEHHVSDSKRRDYYFYRAIKKYGEEKFEISEIEKCSSFEKLKEREIYWITFYDSNNSEFGYNSTLGGDGTIGYKHTESTKKKISISCKNKSKPFSEKHKENLSKSQKGEKNSFFGKHHSQQTLTKMSRIHTKKNKSISDELLLKNYKKKKFNNKGLFVLQFDFQGNFIKEWISAHQAGRELKIDSSDISKVCRNKRTAAGGYIWRYNTPNVDVVSEKNKICIFRKKEL